MLEPISLVYLRAVADGRSIQAAAAALSVSASAISRQIGLLEHELDVHLFARHPRGMTVTPAGRTVYDHAVRLSDDTRYLRNAVTEANRLTGDVRITAVEGVLHALLPAWTQDLRDRHPHLRLRVTQRSSEQVLDAVSSGEADLGFVFGPAARADLVNLAAMSMPVGLAVREDHHLVRRGSCSLADLDGLSFVLPDASFGLRIEVERAFARTGAALHSEVETNSLLYAVEMTELTGLPTFTTAEIVNSAKRSSLRLLPIEDHRLASTRTSLISRVGSLGPTHSEVREFLLRRIAQRPGMHGDANGDLSGGPPPQV